LYFFLFILYCVLGWYVLLKIPFISHSGLPSKIILFLFLIKIFTACFYGWFHYHFYPSTNDTWRYFNQSLREYHLLLNHPMQYLHLTIHQLSYKKNYYDFLGNNSSIWIGIGQFFIIKMLTLMNILSGGNYYIDCILYSWITFFGVIAFYRLYKSAFLFPSSIIFIALYFPSCLFWTSGIHKDGIAFCCIGMLMYCTTLILNRQHSTRYYIVSILSLICIAIIRNYLLIPLLPCILAWFICKKWKKINAIFIYTLVFIFTGVVYFNAGKITPSFNFPEKTISRKNAFYVLQGKSRLSPLKLQPSFRSFLSEAPWAIDHSLFHPYLSELQQPLYIAIGLENLLILLLFLNMCYHFNGWELFFHPILLFNLFFAIPFLLIIGYVVPFLGAIVRYRSIGICLLLLNILVLTNWNFLSNSRLKFLLTKSLCTKSAEVLTK
jgi:hypothetical protein